jgi:hypothetical protein
LIFQRCTPDKRSRQRPLLSPSESVVRKGIEIRVILLMSSLPVMLWHYGCTFLSKNPFTEDMLMVTQKVWNTFLGVSLAMTLTCLGCAASGAGSGSGSLSGSGSGSVSGRASGGGSHSGSGGGSGIGSSSTSSSGSGSTSSSTSSDSQKHSRY